MFILHSAQIHRWAFRTESFTLGILNLKGNLEINWRASNLSCSPRFLKLKELYLGYCKIGMSIEYFKFPDSIEKLMLESKGIKVSFPTSLKHLDLSFNTIQSKNNYMGLNGSFCVVFGDTLKKSNREQNYWNGSINASQFLAHSRHFVRLSAVKEFSCSVMFGRRRQVVQIRTSIPKWGSEEAKVCCWENTIKKKQ